MATLQPQSLDYILPTPDHQSNIFQLKPAQLGKTDADAETFSGFPPCYNHERVWDGAEMALKADDWIMTLTSEDKAHIIKALRHFQGLNLAPGLLNPTTFPLPQELHDRLRTITQDLYNGRGFAILRGLNPDEVTEEENVLIFGGVSSHVAAQRGFQHQDRELVTCHVYSDDLKPKAEVDNKKPAFTNGRLAFHTDLGDILTLFTQATSATGGETMLVSSSQLYNDLSETRPDLLHQFTQPWTFSMSQNFSTDATPLITNAPGSRLVFQYSRLPTTGFRNSGPNPTQPAPSPERLEAMALLESLAWKRAFPLPREKGDVAYINNLCLMHARREFDVDEVSGESLESKRHLVKLMLRDEELSWKLPQSWDWCRERIYGENGGVGGRSERWELSPNKLVMAGKGSYNNG